MAASRINDCQMGLCNRVFCLDRLTQSAISTNLMTKYEILATSNAQYPSSIIANSSPYKQANLDATSSFKAVHKRI